MRRALIYSGLAALFLLILVGSSSALLLEMTKEELIVNSESIVLGTVQEVRSAWAEDRSQIFTYVTLNVSEQFKGEAVGREIVIQIPGGTVGDITQKVSDTPTLLSGMEVILHLFMKETGYPWIYGWEKGALIVEEGAIPEYLMTVDQFRQLVARSSE